MKIVGICEKIEFAVGFRLSGIDCKILKDDNLLKKIEEIARHMNLSAFEILSENPLFKRRRRKKFADELAADDAEEELSKEG